MGKINSRAKGVRGELQLAEILRGYGIDARRGRQYCGDPEAPDVKHAYDDRVCLESKWVEQAGAKKIWEWMRKAEEDAGDRIPVVCWRKNNEGWLAVLRLEDFIPMLKEVMDGR